MVDVNHIKTINWWSFITNLISYLSLNLCVALLLVQRILSIYDNIVCSPVYCQICQCIVTFTDCKMAKNRKTILWTARFFHGQLKGVSWVAGYQRIWPYIDPCCHWLK